MGEKLNSLHLDVLLKGMNEYVEPSDGGYIEFSFNQSGVNWLYSEIQKLNIESLDHGNTGTIQLESFKIYMIGLDKKVPNMVISKVWDAIDTQKVGRITTNEWKQY